MTNLNKLPTFQKNLIIIHIPLVQLTNLKLFKYLSYFLHYLFKVFSHESILDLKYINLWGVVVCYRINYLCADCVCCYKNI